MIVWFWCICITLCQSVCSYRVPALPQKFYFPDTSDWILYIYYFLKTTVNPSKNSVKLIVHTYASTLKNCNFPRLFIGLVLFSELMPITSINSINTLLFVMELQCLSGGRNWTFKYYLYELHLSQCYYLAKTSDLFSEVTRSKHRHMGEKYEKLYAKMMACR